MQNTKTQTLEDKRFLARKTKQRHQNDRPPTAPNWRRKTCRTRKRRNSQRERRQSTEATDAFCVLKQNSISSSRFASNPYRENGALLVAWSDEAQSTERRLMAALEWASGPYIYTEREREKNGCTYESVRREINGSRRKWNSADDFQVVVADEEEDEDRG